MPRIVLSGWRWERSEVHPVILCPLHKVYVLEFLCGWFDRIEYVAQHSDVLVNVFDPGFRVFSPCCVEYMCDASAVAQGAGATVRIKKIGAPTGNAVRERTRAAHNSEY